MKPSTPLPDFLKLLTILMTLSLVVGCGGGSSGSSAENNSSAPVITLQGDNPENIELGSNYTDSGATASSVIDGTVDVTPSGIVDTTTAGTYTVVYSATDTAGTTTTSTRTVIVGASNGLVITIEGDNPTTIELGSPYMDAGALASDADDNPLDVMVSGSVDTTIIGTYPLTYSVTDAAGNTSTAIRTVNVVATGGTGIEDTTLPVITINGENPVIVNQNSVYIDAGASATDNVDSSVSVTSTAISDIDTSIIGSTVIRYYATDVAGNTATTTRTVIIQDAIAPVISLQGSNPTTVIMGVTYIDAGATATDNSDDAVSVSSSGSVDTATPGTYTITYNATDSIGNTAVISRVINVIPRGIEGLVRSYSTGLDLTNIVISTNTQTVLSATDGAYTVENALAERTIVSFSGEGYAPTTQIALTGSASDNRVLLDVDMLPIEFTGIYEPILDFSVEVPDSSAQVIITANSLIDTNNNTPSESIIAELTPINPAQNINLIPGDMTTRSGAPMASYGAIHIEFSDSGSNPLSLIFGETVTIRIPVSNKSSTSPPSTTPLFYFDNIDGFWVQEGSATLSADGTYYEGDINHFGSWNAGYLYDTVSITGCVEDGNGNRVSNALVKVEGFDYNGTTSSRTDSSGNYTVTTLKNGTSIVAASTINAASNTIVIGDNESTATNVPVTDCLVLREDQLSMRLTWGENPSDLDTHLIGPNDYHIWYSDKGSLSVAPFAQLDVDDVSSFGPEILTVLSFPEAGTYHYAIHHFSGTSSISASPARVELTLNGRRSIFVPPTGQTEGDIWWHAFDIEVDSDGTVSVTTINTWSPSQPET